MICVANDLCDGVLHSNRTKILIVGDSGVGKTCFLLRASEDGFAETHTKTLGVDYQLSDHTFDGEPVALQLWDTAGQDTYRTSTSSYYEKVDGVVIVFDVSDPASFNNVRNWVNEVDNYGKPDVGKVIVGNKADLPHAVDDTTAKEYAASIGVPLVFVSLKEGKADEVLDAIIAECPAFKAKKQEQRQRRAASSKKKKKEGGGCAVC
eukprot:TRINITY_DN171_c2_g1_i2.p1 TRINITY_DN171_c2_g1~~TRINITY_DN171_c2_g1_i2.p1  ORF type:complete len:207 (+),score=50.94 TRINITY_DN171_c2_g1_i2:182-802(+)